MKIANQRLIYICLVALLPLFAITSCSDEQAINKPKENGSSGLVLSILMPGKNVPASTQTATEAVTRGMSEIDENNVEEIDILLFNPSTGIFEGLGQCSGLKIQTDGTNLRKKTFSVTLNKTGSFDLVLLANARSLTGGSFAGMTKTEVLESLAVHCSGKWASDGTAPIPMWGEKENVVITEFTDLTGNAIPMTRMLARVDVLLSETAKAVFQLSHVYVYNYNTKGSLAPAEGQWDKTDPASPKATAPNVPSTSTLTKGPLLYKGSEITASDCAAEIYLFEAENHTGKSHSKGKDLLDRTCLVIGGVFDANGDGDFSNDGEPSFFRVDFSKGNGVSQTFLDVLRNHCYTFSITKISDKGYETPEIAFESAPVNVEAEVLEWNDGAIGDIVFDSNNYISFDPAREFVFEYDLGADTVNITTDYPGGWKLVSITEADGITPNSDWLTTDKAVGGSYGGGEEKTALSINVSANDTDSERIGFIIIKTGRIEVKIKITQTVKANLSLELLDEAGVEVKELIFLAQANVAPEAQKLTVNWIPPGGDLTISSSPLLYIPFPETSGAPLTGVVEAGNGGTGTISYTIAPPAITDDELKDNYFFEKGSIVTFSATNGTKTTVKSIILKQRVPNLIINKEKGFYLIDGSTYTFNIKSNTAWRIKSVSGSLSLLALKSSDNLREGYTGGYNIDTGDAITFTVPESTSKEWEGVVDVVFESPDGLFNDQTVSLRISGGYYPTPHKGWAGSNIYWDGEKMTFDDTNDGGPYATYGGLFFHWGSLWGFSPESSWGNATMIYPPDGRKPFRVSDSSYKWKDLPHIDRTLMLDFPSPEGKTWHDRSILYEKNDIDAGIGDICRHITEQAGGTLHGKKWRMPTAREIENMTGFSYKSGQLNPSVDGKGNVNIGFVKEDEGLFFPLSGYIYNNGQFYPIKKAFYWSGSIVIREINAYVMAFNRNEKEPILERHGRSSGYSIRCVQE